MRVGVISHLPNPTYDQIRSLARAAGCPVKVQWSRAEEFHWGYLRPAALIDISASADAAGAITGWSVTNINSGPAGLLTPGQTVTIEATLSCPADDPAQVVVTSDHQDRFPGLQLTIPVGQNKGSGQATVGSGSSATAGAPASADSFAAHSRPPRTSGCYAAQT